MKRNNIYDVENGIEITVDRNVEVPDFLIHSTRNAIELRTDSWDGYPSEDNVIVIGVEGQYFMLDGSRHYYYPVKRRGYKYSLFRSLIGDTRTYVTWKILPYTVRKAISSIDDIEDGNECPVWGCSCSGCHGNQCSDDPESECFSDCSYRCGQEKYAHTNCYICRGCGERCTLSYEQLLNSSCYHKVIEVVTL